METGCGEARSLEGSGDGESVVCCLSRSHLDGSIFEVDDEGRYCSGERVRLS